MINPMSILIAQTFIFFFESKYKRKQSVVYKSCVFMVQVFYTLNIFFVAKTFPVKSINN